LQNKSPPNTAFRGFGAPQAMFLFESALTRAAEELEIHPSEIQKKNLLKEGDEFPYGQKALSCNALQSWVQADESFNFKKQFSRVEKFNRENIDFKMGVSVYPLCFGISFTKTSLNQGSSLVHIYTDGTVSVSTGVIEMGQGVNTKIVEVAARTLGITADKINIVSSNTTRVANASPTAASSGADLNGKATIVACTKIKERLLEVASSILKEELNSISIDNGVVIVKKKQTELTFEKLVFEAYEARVSLSEHGHYKTPKINFDKEKEKGSPFAYHVYGTAITTVKLDCIRGIYDVESVKIVHDFGSSFNLEIDKGQVEGALVQGIGLMSIEELEFNPNGSLRSNSLSSYKIPDIYTAPKELEVEALKSGPDKLALLGSKAVGEPPLMYGIGTYFAVQMAIKAYRPDYKIEYSAPATYQKVLRSLY
jgi:xanthine dehydrogenase large subunit